MSIKKLGTQLRELLAGLDKDEKLTPTELLQRVEKLTVNKSQSDVVISEALKKPRFIGKVAKAARRSDSGRVVLYARKGEPMVMTLERMELLHRTVKNAQEGVRKYWSTRKVKGS